jgi:hypothetical protein
MPISACDAVISIATASTGAVQSRAGVVTVRRLGGSRD